MVRTEDLKIMDSNLICIYVNASGGVSVQALSDVQEVESHTSDYFYYSGWSEAQKKVKTLRSDRVIKKFDSIEEAKTQLIDIDISQYALHINPPSFRRSQPDSFDICFTGFKKADKEELSTLAKEHNINICKSVTKHLNMLCCGDNAGPTKVRDAMKKGIFIVDGEQFKTFVETGEIPESL